MSALTDRLYRQWLVVNGSEVGAQRRSRSEGYPKNQPKSSARSGRSGAPGAALARVPLRGHSAALAEALPAPCGLSSLPSSTVSK